MLNLYTKILLGINESASSSHNFEWSYGIPWKKLESCVKKLQQRIYHAECQGKRRKVRNLQRLLMRSQSSLLLSIKRVTQINKGKRTAGVDGYKVLKSDERIRLYKDMRSKNHKQHNPKPAYRTYISKKNGKLRPLGIPTIRDRIYQNIVKMALEPQWEVRFESTSYGFRPKRGCHDAIERIYSVLRGGKKQWIFEGDFKGCFDNLNHEFIIKQLGNFPASKLIQKWLKAGFVDNGVFNETNVGTPQGGIVSPLLANIALHGLEELLGITHKAINRKTGTTYECRSKIVMVRYADDFVIMCENKQDADEMYEKLKPYLTLRGLELAMDKTKVSHVKDGFDFLGLNVRRYKTYYGSKLLTKPSNKSIKSAKGKIKEVVDKITGKNVGDLIAILNPIIMGTANYWKPFVSKETFSKMDYYIWTKIYKFIRRLHPKKTWDWIKKRYFHTDKTGQSTNKWILTDPLSGNQLRKMHWTPIERHVPIIHNYSPYNKELKDYFLKRDIKEFDMNNVTYRQKLAKKQQYVCLMCGNSIADFREGLETHHKIPRIQGGNNQYTNLQLVHISCHIDYHKVFPAKGIIPTANQVKELIKALKLIRTVE